MKITLKRLKDNINFDFNERNFKVTMLKSPKEWEVVECPEALLAEIKKTVEDENPRNAFFEKVEGTNKYKEKEKVIIETLIERDGSKIVTELKVKK